MSAAHTPIHRPGGSLHGDRVLIAVGGVMLAAILVALLVSRIFSASTGASAAATQSRAVPYFNGLDLTGANNVIVHAGTRQSVIVHADKDMLDRVTTHVRSGILVVGNTRGNFSSKTPMFVVVTAPNLDALRLDGAGNITVTGISNRSFTVSIPGSGNIGASGSTARLDVAISGTGTALLSTLISRDARASLSGEGTIMLTATHSLRATLSGSGTIAYGGNPPALTRAVTGSGEITPG
jgi:Putative auto-transporter adhesin, head GIN domain